MTYVPVVKLVIPQIAEETANKMSIFLREPFHLVYVGQLQTKK